MWKNIHGTGKDCQKKSSLPYANHIITKCKWKIGIKVSLVVLRIEIESWAGELSLELRGHYLEKVTAKKISATRNDS